jgi:spermidine synthase
MPAQTMSLNTWKVAALLFLSGACALVYQTSWLRQFRVIFGTSTYASAAVLAIFMGGLGIGSWLLGRRADRDERPLAFYGKLEIGIALSAAITPAVLLFVRWIYIATGGSSTMGLAFATIVRVLLSALVLAIPTILMGGTLPAAARAVESEADAGRKRLALLYGANTIGAVTGALLSTFYLLEHLGNRNALLVAAVVNVVVGVVAIVIGRTPAPASAPHPDPLPAARGEGTGVGIGRRLILMAAFITGFVFLLMELVWYRMLSPLLGGTTFMFGLILAVALAGIGLGGAVYSLWGGGGRASVGGFAFTCTLEALAVIAPYALGDNLALIALYLRPLGTLGFGGYVLAWVLVTMAVVFPAAFIAGIQFPMLISLLGRGRDDIGRDVGSAYAWNTAGAIAGSLAGGFGLMPLLTAPGSWQLVTYLLVILGIAAVVYAVKQKELALAGAAVAVAILALAGTTATGPTAPWRHSGIGAGRAESPNSPVTARDWLARERRTLVWDADGRESSIALYAETDLSLIVNGKSDGTARADAGTQVMSGLIPAFIKGNTKTAAVVGLGTGTTAGWLAMIPSMERVDVIELEPVVVEAAKEFALVNADVLKNPKVHMAVGDAREILVTSRRTYDIIFSEPSNPYRAGIASLYTKEFYAAAAGRLNKGGVFAQWMQSYGADASTIRTVYATLSTVFPHIETWWTNRGDLLLFASREPVVYDMDVLRARMTTEPYRSAMHQAWRAETLEAFFAHYVASDAFAARVRQGALLNTDDRTVIEFSFARTLNTGSFSTTVLRSAARTVREHRPRQTRGAIDWQQVDDNTSTGLPDDSPRGRFTTAYDRRNFVQAYEIYAAAPWQPLNSQELAAVAFTLAEAGDVAAEELIEYLGRWQPLEAEAIRARLRMRQGRNKEAAQHLLRAYIGYRTDPWPLPALMRNSLDTAMVLANDSEAAPVVLAALSKPFASGQWNAGRQVVGLGVAEKMGGCGPETIASLQAFEPYPLWRPHTLKLRAECYTLRNHPLAEKARRDYQAFLTAEPPQLLSESPQLLQGRP